MSRGHSLAIAAFGSLICLTPGCAKTAADSAPSQDPTRFDDGDAPPTEAGFTYRSGSGEDGTKGDSGSEESPTTVLDAPEGAITTAEEAHQRITEEADKVLDPYGARVVTPLIPNAWPGVDGKVVAYVYPEVPKEAGMMSFELEAARLKITLDANTGAATTEQLPEAEPLGDIEEGRSKSFDRFQIAEAEQALLEVVLGVEKSDKAAYRIKSLQLWMKEHPRVSKDLKKREPTFTGWLSGLR